MKINLNGIIKNTHQMLPPNNICLTEVIRRIKMNEIKDCIIIGNTFFDLHIIPCFKLQETSNPTSKEIRLALDIITQCYPLYKRADMKTKAEFVKDIFNFNVPLERITRIKPFKQILFKKIITKIKPISNSNKYETIIKKVRK